MLNRKSMLLVLFLFFFSFSLSQNNYAIPIDKMIVFGDSLSDNGNLFSLTSEFHNIISQFPILPKDPPYFHGRFSNGSVWVEYLAQILNVPLLDFAYGGAWVEGTMNAGFTLPFSLGMQVNMYMMHTVTDPDPHKSNHLYIIWAGGNDYTEGRHHLNQSTTNTVSVIKDQIDWLIYVGASNFLILNLPDLSKTPEVVARGADFVREVQQLITLHNEKLAEMIAAEKQKYPNVKFILVDVMSYSKELIAHADQYGFKNVTDACYNGKYFLPKEMQQLLSPNLSQNLTNNTSLRVAYLTSLIKAKDNAICAQPDTYLFWDHIHPTRVVHMLLSTMILNILHTNDIM